MLFKSLTIFLVALVVHLDMSLRDLQERLEVMDKELTSQQQYIETYHSVLLNHRNHLEALLKRFKNSIIWTHSNKPKES